MSEVQTHKPYKLGKWVARSILLVGVVLLYASCQRSGYVPQVTAWPSIVKLSDEVKADPQFYSEYRVYIKKGERSLSVYLGEQEIKTYAVVFGGNSKGPKLNEGDLRTPEGTYRVLGVYDHPEWSKFIWLDYPNIEDWQRHLLGKLKGQVPFFFPIGGEIGIHGVPFGGEMWIKQRYDWTLGCIALSNEDVNDLTKYVKEGTFVVISP